jgi:hypothetical protein
MRRLLLGSLVLLAACGGSESDHAGISPIDPGRSPGEPAPRGLVGACSDLFDEDAVATYELQIDPQEWNAIHDEFVNWPARQAAGLVLNPYHPVVFKRGAEEVPAWIRLRGNSSWFQAVATNPNVKKQFLIAFDQGEDSRAQFHGVQKLDLDAPTIDPTFLRERIANSYLRDIGLPAICASSARLFVNGQYYGLYSNLEHINKDFLERVFPGEEDGDLWQRRSELKTNEDDPNHDDSRVRALWTTSSVPELEQLMDMEGSLRTWAAEAVLQQSDGYWGAKSNFYVYDHPRRGFLWLTDDMDGALNFLPPTVHPLYWWLDRDYRRTPGPQWVALMADERWRNRFVEILAQLVEGLDLPGLQARVDGWAAQIAEPLASDPNKVGTVERSRAEQAELRAFLGLRRDYLRGWIRCYQGGGDDLDGDGHAWCRDCNDSSPGEHPGAPEICGDEVDQNCNGRFDDCS